ncbi:MAG: HAD family hydrolase, partial [Spirochaetales bacterium]
QRRPFTHDRDYVPYVDGKPRYDGVKSFLESRGVSLPFGPPEDAPGAETVCGIGNEKNVQFRRIVERDGVDIYDSTVAFIDALAERGVQLGVASSSKNATFILETTGLLARFATVVDGNTSAELGLSGKPAPDIFLTAAERLSVRPERSLMVEDAYSGVEAGRRGGFGLVIGIARSGDPEELKRRGADIAVSDMSEFTIEQTERWFESR